MIAKRKNAAEYQTKRSAVKKIQKEKSGIDKTRQVIPAQTIIFGFLWITKNKKTIKNRTSCIFIVYFTLILIPYIINFCDIQIIAYR